MFLIYFIDGILVAYILLAVIQLVLMNYIVEALRAPVYGWCYVFLPCNS